MSALAIDEEGLALGQPFTIQVSVPERFVDERPATLVRNVADDATGARTLFVRDETNGRVRAFHNAAGAAELTERALDALGAPGKRSVLAPSPPLRDGVVLHERARIQSCDLCGEPDVFGAIAHLRGRCGRCITPEACVRSAQPGVDPDFARALVRHELALEEQPSLRRALAALDGTAPWLFVDDAFAQPVWGLDDALSARAALLEMAWAGTLGPAGSVVAPLITISAWRRGLAQVWSAHHPWSVRGHARFLVGVDDITAVANGDVVAVRVE